MSDKKLIRKNFRENSLKRDKYRCVCCGIPGFDRQGGDLHKKFHNQGINIVPLDVHHITPRNEMENGGYTFKNGISCCSDCHLKCEYYLLHCKYKETFLDSNDKPYDQNGPQLLIIGINLYQT